MCVGGGRGQRGSKKVWCVSRGQNPVDVHTAARAMCLIGQRNCVC